MSKLLARIHQGRYDTELELLRLRENALRRSYVSILDAVHQRMKIVCPKQYQRLVGPLRDRVRDKKFKCYCNHPKPLQEICADILKGQVPFDALTCDACWSEDLATTWGYYGWSTKVISEQTWKSLCDERAQVKFVG